MCLARNLVLLVTSAAALLALMVLAVLPGAAQPIAVSPAQRPHISAVFDAETLRPQPGAGTTIAIRMRPEPGWHGYWLNGGDAGFGMQVEWTLPPGVTMGELSYPVPDTLVIAGLMNHVYERPYSLIAYLSVAPSVPQGTPLTIRGEARWLACTDEICVPEGSTLELDLVAGDGSINPDDRARFDEDRSDLPPPISAPVHYSLDANRLRFALPVPASLALDGPHLFIAERNLNQPGAAQQFSRRGDLLIVEMAAGDSTDKAEHIDGVLRTGQSRGLSFSAQPGDVPPAGEPLRQERPAATLLNNGLFWTALLGAIAGGLLLNIMPCVFPILSLKALTLARAGGDERNARQEGVAYTAGAVLTSLGLGTMLMLLRAGGEAVGWAFQLQRPASVILLIVLMAAITANLAGFFELRTVPFAQGRARIRSNSDELSLSSPRRAMATGALAAFIATPCSGPFLGAALGATLALPAWAALPIFAGLGFGLALPFLAIALMPALRKRMPRPGPWMDSFRRWLAIPMALTAMALIWLLGRQVGPAGWMIGTALAIAALASAWWAGRLQKRGESGAIALFAMAAMIIPASLLVPSFASQDALATTGASSGNATPWSAENEARARATGRPTFVYFTADWCVSCKVNEAAAINRAEVQNAFANAGVSVLVADWTHADPDITRRLETEGRNSIPLYLWYPAGSDAPEVLPQLLTPAMLVDLARAR